MSPRAFPIERLWLPLVAGLLLAIYIPGLGNEPVFDDEYLTSGRLFTEYATLWPLKVRALAYGSFVALQSLFGEGWWKQRVFNLVIHFGVVVALYELYREVLRHIETPVDDWGKPIEASGYDRSPALGLAVAFFALNPVAAYAVAYLVQRSILLATLFTVLGLWLFARGLRKKRWGFHVAAFACYVLAVLSKEHAILAPLAAIPLYILVARPGARRLGTLAAAGLGIVIVAGAVLYLRYGEIIGKPFDEYSHVYLDQLARLDPDAVRHSYILSIVNEAWLYFQYGLRWAFPLDDWLSINLRPPFPTTLFAFPQVLGVFGYVAVLVGGFFLLLRFRDWRALVGFSLLVPALLYPTEFATVWVQDPFVLYRSYLWAIGLPGLVFFLVHGQSPRVLLAIGVIVGSILAWEALDRVISMSTTEKVWTDAIRKLPNDPRAVGRWFPYLNRGTAYADQNLFDLAMVDFDQSSALGDLGMGAANLGSMLTAKGRFKEALAAFDRAEKEGYNLYNLPFQRGLALLGLGNAADAYTQFQKAYALNPPSPAREIVLSQMARAALQMQRPDDAIAALNTLLKTAPRDPEARYLLGMAHVVKKDYASALPPLDALVKDDPTRKAYYARALAHYGLQHKAEALADIDNAIRLGDFDAHLDEWRKRILALP